MVNQRHFDGLDACLDDLVRELERLQGVVLTSGKRSFFSGPDVVLSEIPVEELRNTYALVVPIRDQLRRLETMGRPAVAALTGSALGSGFEIALACHHRVGLDTRETVWGLPEVGMRIMPGGGGLVRVTRMFGVVPAVEEIVGPGAVYRPRAALQAGLVDELAATRELVIERARTWFQSSWLVPGDGFGQPWERPGREIPGSSELDRTLPELAARVRSRVDGTPLLALPAILRVATVAATSQIDTAFAAETAAFLDLLHAPATAALAPLYFDLVAVAHDHANQAAVGDSARAVTDALLDAVYAATAQAVQNTSISASDANTCSIYAVGLPKWTGGAAQLSASRAV